LLEENNLCSLIASTIFKSPVGLLILFASFEKVGICFSFLRIGFSCLLTLKIRVHNDVDAYGSASGALDKINPNLK
jgi:hypothetical protein